MTKRKVKTIYEVGDIILAKMKDGKVPRINPYVIYKITVVNGHQTIIYAHATEGVQFDEGKKGEEIDKNEFMFLLSQWKLTVVGKVKK